MKIWTAIVAIVCAAVLSGFTPWLRGAVTIVPSSIISSVGPATASYTTGILTNTVIAPVSVTMSPATPTFSGTLALSGTTNFALSSSTLPANIIANGTTPTCTSATPSTFNLVATQAGATGSPYTQSVTVTCNPPAGAFFVQGTTHQNGSPSSTTVVAVLPSTVGIGDTVFISLGWAGTSDTVTSIIDDKLNSYTPVDLQVSTADSYTWVSGYAVNITNGPKTITATLSSPVPFASIIVDEFSGIPSTATLDNHAINNQSLTCPCATDAITSPVVSIVGGDFVYGASVNILGNGTESAGTGFTVTQHTPSAFISEYQNGATAGSKAATFTPTASSDWLTYMLALKSGGGGGGGSTIASVSPAAASYTTGITTGTTVSPISVTMSPATPAFSGTLALTGTTNFAISSSTLPSNLTATSTTPTCTTSTPQTPFNIVATQAGATGSPFTQSVTVTCNPVGSLTTTSLFKATDTPASIDSTDPTAGVYGVQFTPQTSGNATGCKFYKASTNTGTHVCTLWTSSGTQLATVTVTGETATGWQTQNFSSSVALTAGTQYVIGVWDPAGHYSDDASFFNTQYVSDVDGQILAPATGSTTNGKGNGVYSQVTSTTFPTLTFNATNYWADVVYQYTPVPQAIASLALSGTSITNNAPSGFTVGTASATMSPSTPVFTGTFSLSQTQGGCNSTNGVNNSSFVFSGTTLNTSVANIPTGPYAICVLATQAGATNNPQGQPFTVNSAPQTISAISFSTTFFPPSTAGPIGTASAAMTPSTPAFSGSWSIPTSGSVTGSTWSSGTGGTLCDTSGFFTVSGNTVSVSASATTTTYHVCLIATQSGATGSPYAAVINLTGTTGGAVTFTPLHTYFLSPTGSDSNNGTSAATPWQTPNHSVVCGDVIIAAAGSYTTNFQDTFGTVSSCPSTTGGIDGTGGIYFATLLCAGPDLHSCNVSTTAGGGPTGIFDIQHNNWAVEGFNATAGGPFARGYNIVPPNQTTLLHHFAFVNDIAFNSNVGFSDNDCLGGTCNHLTPAAGGNGVDYYAIVGDIAQNSAQDTICLGAIDIVSPSYVDTLPGTHYLFYGNFSWNQPNNGCISDQEDFMFDTFDAHGSIQQGVAMNNIGWSAYRYGLLLYVQGNNSTVGLHVYFENNTMFNNQILNTGSAGDITIQNNTTTATTVTVYNNIALSTMSSDFGATVGDCGSLSGCSPADLANVDTGTVGNENIFFGINGAQPFFGFNGYTFSAHNFSENPNFTNTADLLSNRTTPNINCTGFTTTTACMGWNAVTSTLTIPSVISDLTPSSAHSAGKGYQKPSTTCATNALYPTWLKGIVYLHWNGTSITENADLVTKPCGL